MKIKIKIWLAMSILACTIITVNGQVIKKKDKTSGIKTPSTEIMNFDCQDAKYSLPEHKISFDTAVDHIYSFDTSYSYQAIHKGGWFEIKRETVQKMVEEKHCGLIVYFLLKGGVFIGAYKDTNNLVAGSDPFPPRTNEVFLLADCDRAFAPANFATKADLSNFLKTYKQDCSYPDDTIIERYVNQYGKDFMDTIIQANRNIEKVCDEPVGFIHFEQLKEVISQNDLASDVNKKCRGIRIYWGFNDDYPHYKIRLVVFGAQNDGYNVWQKYDGSKAVILQKSWPPF